MKNKYGLLAVAVLCAAAAVPARADAISAYNRVVCRVNFAAYDNVIRPAGRFYQSTMPEFLRDGVHNVAMNLGKPVTFGNEVLEGRVKDAGQTALRVIVNSTIGLGGLFDPASRLGIGDHNADFGETLAVWGVTDGGRVVELPIAGPSNPRDIGGMAADAAMDPANYVAFRGHDTRVYVIAGGTEKFDAAVKNIAVVDGIERGSIDRCAAIESAYVQHRAEEVRRARGEGDSPNAN